MQRMALLCIVVLVGMDAGRLLAQEHSTWELRGNRWEQVAVPAAATSTADATTQPDPQRDPVLEQAEQLIDQGKPRSALKVLLPWIKTRQASPVYDRGLFLMAEALYQKGDRIRSFYYLDQLMDQYPASPLYYAALQKQYDIADAYLEGYKRRFLGLPILSAENEAIEMLYRIQQRSPGSPLSEKALLRTADWYYADSQFDFAADAYAAYLRSYPRSPVVPRVKLRLAFSYLAQFRGLRFDATPIIDARERLLEVQAQYPELAAEENVGMVIERIDETFARKLYVTGDFYRRTHEPRGAAYTYQYLIAHYPQTPEAELAQRQLTSLPEQARQEAAAPPPAREALP